MSKELKEMTAAVAEAGPPSVGEELAESVVGTIEADMSLAIHRRALAGAQARLRKINDDFRAMIAGVNANYTEAEATLVRLGIEGMRDELVKCYLTVSPALAHTPAGRAQVATMVDTVIAATLAQIPGPEAAKRPTKARAAA